VNSGVIAPGYGNAMGVLTVQGKYVGAGGRLEIATVLGNDSSPTSRLVINGATSGTTRVDVINRGGLGAQT
ncbi:autotransporter outer membrane beta-barrel domain-containing protein, partial [Acinetobacter baumannii]|uniref:autotransporter outer membrane beta-barrel domain-containing protein n=1 Tax=Acinetobacter baumannii TaxID=470 RepID=UPI0013D0CBFE